MQAHAENNMTTPIDQLIRLGDLRKRAYARLIGSTPPADIAANATAALGVLHELASSPDTAADALALLHELQVHQIEIEAQSEDLRATLADADAALSQQTQYLNDMPAACIHIDAYGKLLAINLTGARWLGVDQGALKGQTLSAYLPPLSTAELSKQLKALDRGLTPASWHTVLLAEGQAPRSLLASVNAAPSAAGHYIVVLMEVPPGTAH